MTFPEVFFTVKNFNKMHAFTFLVMNEILAKILKHSNGKVSFLHLVPQLWRFWKTMRRTSLEIFHSRTWFLSQKNDIYMIHSLINHVMYSLWRVKVVNEACAEAENLLWSTSPSFFYSNYFHLITVLVYGISWRWASDHRKL